MSDAFIIMQIGNPDLDEVCEKAIVPALVACGLNPKRVDKHTEGRLLKSEIIRFIESSDIIVADLTNERPNVYLEVGYTMGVDKFRNLVLTARADHNVGSNEHQTGGPKVHFDLAGYDVLFWRAEDLPAFRSELEKRVRRRRAVIAPSAVRPVWDAAWVERHRGIALEGLGKHGMRGSMEASFALVGASLAKSQAELLEAGRQAEIHTFGWPIGIVLDRPEYRPRPTTDGIVAEVAVTRGGGGPLDGQSYDYWALRRSGEFYLLQSLFEDFRSKDNLFFDTRVVRVTELLLYCARLYSRLGVDPTTSVAIEVTHRGLKGRLLTSAGGSRRLYSDRVTTEDEVRTEVRVTLAEIEADLVSIVTRLLQPLFVVFDFFELDPTVYGQLVDGFVAGKIV